jgi:hypothetical protein
MKHNELPLGWIEVAVVGSGLAYVQASKVTTVVQGTRINCDGGSLIYDGGEEPLRAAVPATEVLRRIAEAQARERAATVVAAFDDRGPEGATIVTADGVRWTFFFDSTEGRARWKSYASPITPNSRLGGEE